MELWNEITTVIGRRSCGILWEIKNRSTCYFLPLNISVIFSLVDVLSVDLKTLAEGFYFLF